MSNLGGGRPPKNPPIQKTAAPKKAQAKKRSSKARPVHSPPRLTAVRAAAQKQASVGPTAEDWTSAGLPAIGEPDLDLETLRTLSPSMVAEHLMIVLSRKRLDAERHDVLEDVTRMLIDLQRPALVAKILNLMPQVGRIVDIYPLEVMVEVMHEAPDLVPKVTFGSFIKNRTELESQTFKVEDAIEIRLPLAIQVRAFAIQGGGSPGYCFAPGPPGSYILELGEVGAYTFLIRGEVNGRSKVEHLAIQVVDPVPSYD